jgi:3-methyladenine DNA glycosylase AlkD
MKASAMKRVLRAHADPSRVPILRRFFKTGAGEYGEGDEFVGVTVPALRKVCRQCQGTSLDEVRILLGSRIHEDRALALFLLVDAFTDGNVAERRRIYDFYLSQTSRINNWDLVDCSAGAIVGGWLWDRSRAPLRALARSESLWERRIAIVATHYFIRRGQYEDTLTIADLLLHDRHDLIHKAVGWMLREVGKRDGALERQFLDTRAAHMPRTMLRYAIERFPAAERAAYLRMGREMSVTTSRNRRSRGARNTL